MPKVYRETFDDGAGGWVADLAGRLPVWDGVAYCHGPWSVDANHAPPGAGYLHLLMYLPTKPWGAPEETRKHGANRFLADGHSTNLLDARLTVRLRGYLDLTGPLCNYHRAEPRPDINGARLALLVQSNLKGPPQRAVNYVLTGQPLEVTPQWSEQTLHLTPDPQQWTCLGGRHDLTDTYGYGEIDDVLRNVNIDIIFVLFPLVIEPIGQVTDRDKMWAAKDYKVDMAPLPKGLVMFDTVQIEYPR